MSFSRPRPTDGNFKGSIVDFPMTRKDSIIVKIKTARSSTSGTRDFFSSVLLIIMQTFFFSLMIIISLAIPLCKVTMGAIQFSKCPVEPLLPIYLIASGSVAAFFDLVVIVIRLMVTTKEAYYRNYSTLTSFFCVSAICNTGLLVFGCVIVFPMVNHFSYEASHSNFCNPFLFWFTFWVIILHILLYAIGIVSCMFITCLICLSPPNQVTTLEIATQAHKEDHKPAILSQIKEEAETDEII